MDNCVFCKIIKGEIPAAKVFEDEIFLAFLSIAPINPGHTLVIPKKHIDYIFDLDEKTLGSLFIKCKPLAQAIEKTFHPATGKVGIMVAGLEIPHAHIHLIPINSEGDLNFANAKKGVSFTKLEEDAQKIKGNLKIS